MIPEGKFMKQEFISFAQNVMLMEKIFVIGGKIENIKESLESSEKGRDIIELHL